MHRLYQLDLKDFDLAIEVLQEWRLDRYYEGKTKLIYDAKTDRLLGAGLVGVHAGELLGELTLALEFGASVEDIALTIHAHPTLHESVGLAAELGAGTITDLPNPKASLKK